MGRLKAFRHLGILALFLLFAVSAWAEVCPGSKIPRAEREQYDAQAALSPTEAELAIKTHLPWGQPACPKLLRSREYVLCYTPAHRVALWAAYQLRAEDIVSATRRDAFRTDPRLTADENAHCDDHKGSGYDRGHTVPNADMNRSPRTQANTFFLSNMTPQSPALNRGLWRYLEELVRDYAKKYGVVYIVTGSILQEPVQTVPSGRVGIPSRYYKTLLRVDANGNVAAVLSVYLPNLLEGLHLPPGTPGAPGQRIGAEASDAFLAGHTVSIREIETLTGLDLLPRLDGESLKKAVASRLWPRN